MTTQQKVDAWCSDTSKVGEDIFLHNPTAKCRFKKVCPRKQSGGEFYVYMTHHPVESGTIHKMSNEVDWETTLANSPTQSSPAVPPAQATGAEVRAVPPAQATWAEVPLYVQYLYLFFGNGSGNTNLQPQDLRSEESDRDYTEENYSQMKCDYPYGSTQISWAGRQLYLTTNFTKDFDCSTFWNIPSHSGLGICNDTSVNDAVNVSKAAAAVAGDWRRMNRMTLRGK